MTQDISPQRQLPPQHATPHASGKPVFITRHFFNTRYALIPRFALVILALCLSATFGHAQNTLRNLSGTVTDPEHEPLKGAVVEVENQTTHSVVSYITNETGRYSFKRLSGDTDYSIWATFRGHQTKPRTLSFFDTKPNPTLDIVVHLH